MENQGLTCYFCIKPPIVEKTCSSIKLCNFHYYYLKTVYTRFKDHPYNNYLDLNLTKFEGFFKTKLNFYEDFEIYTKDEWDRSKLVLINNLLQKEKQIFIEAHTFIITQILYCPIKNLIVTVDYQNTIGIWDYLTKQQIYKLLYRDKRPFNQSSLKFTVKISKRFEFLVIASESESVQIWYYKEDRSVYVKGLVKKINSVFIFNDEKTLAAIGNDEVFLIDMEKLVKTFSFKFNSNYFSCEVSEVGKIVFISKSYYKTVKIFDALTGIQEKEFELKSTPSLFSLNSTGNFLALQSSIGIISIIDLNTEKIEYELKGHSQRIEVILFTSNSSHLISGGLDDFILIWSLQSYSIESKIQLNKFGITSAVLIERDNILAIGTLNNVFKFIDLNNSENIIVAPGHNDHVLSLAINNTYTKIASGSHDRNIILWNVNDRSCVKNVDAHDTCVNCLCFSNNDKFLVSGGLDMVIKVWDLENFQLFGRFEGHDMRIEQVYVSSDDKIIVSGSGDMTFKVWEIGYGYKGFAYSDSLVEKIGTLSRSGKYIVVSKFLDFKVLKINT